MAAAVAASFSIVFLFLLPFGRPRARFAGESVEGAAAAAVAREDPLVPPAAVAVEREGHLAPLEVVAAATAEEWQDPPAHPAAVAAAVRVPLLAPLGAMGAWEELQAHPEAARLAYPPAGRPCRRARTVEEAAPSPRSPVVRSLLGDSKAEVAVTRSTAQGAFGGVRRGVVYGLMRVTCCRQYGSGYPGVVGRGVAGRNFPFYFWPLTFGGVGAAGAYHYLDGDGEVSYEQNLISYI